MRVLQLSPKVPWPPEDGGRVASRVLALSLLRAGAEVRLLSLNPAKHRVEAAALPAEARAVRLETVDHDTSLSVAGLLGSLLRGTSYNVDRFRSAAFERRVAAVIREEPPDVVLLESLYLLPSLPALRRATRAPVVLRSYNIEHEIWYRLVPGERNPVRRLLLAHLARRLRAFEIDARNAPDAIVPVTAEDAETYRRLGTTVPIHVAPVGLETARVPDRSGEGERGTLVFLGALDWRPNLEGIRWFLDRVWPAIQRAVPRARLVVGGSNPPAGLEKSLSGEGVTCVGRVPDAHAFFASGAAMIVPLLSGGGMRVKILEAMALGVPVVSTRLGATGIEARDGVEIRLADEPDLMAAACIELLSDPTGAVELGRAGRRTVLARFGADVIACELLRFLAALDRRREPDSGSSRHFSGPILTRGR
jgi:glycosyltransferase involved in cell wall biosynthesis